MGWSEFTVGLDAALNEAIETAFCQGDSSVAFDGFEEMWQALDAKDHRALTAKLSFEEGKHRLISKGERILTLEHVSKVALGIKVDGFYTGSSTGIISQVREQIFYDLTNSKLTQVEATVDETGKLLFFLIWLGLFVGNLASAIQLVVDHVKTRKQFGRPVGSFQLVQDHLVSSFVIYEHLKRTLEIAAVESNIDYNLLSKNVFRFVAQTGDELDRLIQAVGGIGFTKEFQLGDRLRVALALADSVRE